MSPHSKAHRLPAGQALDLSEDSAKVAAKLDYRPGDLMISGTASLGSFQLRVNHVFKADRVTAILGPVGSGKTLLLEVLSGMHFLNEGEIRGDRLWDAPPKAAVPSNRRRAAYIPPGGGLFPHLRAEDNVIFGARMAGMSFSEAHSVAQKELAAMGATGFASRKLSQLAMSQVMRVSVARALSAKPTALLINRPLHGVDELSHSGLRNVLRRRLEQTKYPVIISTNDILDAVTLADDMVVLENGRIVQSGTVRAILADPRSAYLIQSAGVNLWIARGDGSGAYVVEGEMALSDQQPNDSSDPTSGQAVIWAGAKVRGRVWLINQPSSVSLWRSQPDGPARNTWKLRVVSVRAFGQMVSVTLSPGLMNLPSHDDSTLETDQLKPYRLVSVVTHNTARDLEIEPGQSVWATFKASHVEVYPA